MTTQYLFDIGFTGLPSIIYYDINALQIMGLVSMLYVALVAAWPVMSAESVGRSSAMNAKDVYPPEGAAIHHNGHEDKRQTPLNSFHRGCIDRKDLR